MRRLLALTLSLSLALAPLTVRAVDRPLSLAIMYSYGSEITSGWYTDSVRTIREAVAPRPLKVSTYDRFKRPHKPHDQPHGRDSAPCHHHQPDA